VHTFLSLGRAALQLVKEDIAAADKSLKRKHGVMKEFFGCEDATVQWLCGDSPMRTGFSVIDLGLEADAIGRGGIVVGGCPGVGAIDGVGELDGEFHGIPR
jgi:hypothetical protein